MAVVGVVERAEVAIAFGLAFFFSLLVIITFSVYQVGVEVYVELLYAALDVYKRQIKKGRDIISAVRQFVPDSPVSRLRRTSVRG